MSTRTKVILLLVVMALLYLATFGLGLVRHNQSGPASVGKTGGLGPLASLRSWFAPSLELGSLRCSGPSGLNLKVNAEFELDENDDTCTVDIGRDNKNEYRVAELKVLNKNSAVYLFAAYEAGNDPREPGYRDADFRKAERDRSTCILDEDSIRDRFRLQITFPSDDGKNWSCWLKQKPDKDGGFTIPLTVLEDGGDLTLECVGCKRQSGRTLRLLME